MFFIHGGAFYMGTYAGMGPKELLEKGSILHNSILAENISKFGQISTKKTKRYIFI
jgi:hypothetical protein